MYHVIMILSQIIFIYLRDSTSYLREVRKSKFVSNFFFYI
nr:MAG TPA: hypothetical protein [Caudoviricetes sp.]